MLVQSCLESTECVLHKERQSVNDVHAELQRARPPEATDAAREAHMLRDQLEAVTAERDQLVHEVAMVRETIHHDRRKSVEAARSSRSEVPPDSIAGQFHAHTERIRELQTDLEVRHQPDGRLRACARSPPIRCSALIQASACPVLKLGCMIWRTPYVEAHAC